MTQRGSHYLQHVTKKTDNFLVKIFRDGEDSRLNPSEKCVDVLIIKRKDTTKKGVEHHPA